jgi:hypothetical protein
MTAVTIQLEGLDALRRQLDSFSDRRFRAAVATATSRTAVALKADMRGKLPQVFDRPTPYTLNSLFVKPATAQDMAAVVWFKDELAVSQQGTPATKYLLPQVVGGSRGIKRAERLLQMAGHLPAGYVMVPGAGARLDRYGNMDRGQLIQVLSQLRITGTAGYARNLSFNAGKQVAALRKAGGRFFVRPVGGQVAPGVYQRELTGRNVTPVLIFVKSAAYRRRFDFEGLARRFAAQRLPVETKRAVDEHVARMAKQ